MPYYGYNGYSVQCKVSPLVVKWLDRFNSLEGFTAQRWVSTRLGFPKNSFEPRIYTFSPIFVILIVFHLFAWREFHGRSPLHRLSDQSFIGAVARILFRVAKDSISFCQQNIIGARHNIQRGMRRPGCHWGLARFGLADLFCSTWIFFCQTNTF